MVLSCRGSGPAVLASVLILLLKVITF